ncbi:MAG TPA: UDP-N-acetylmuramate dehydrogenase [Thermomicrobiaceae bacterium]|nr:UDP-N-acetylmuramate dehydrogenase [Thermomicrobiaceae bacterium]
MTRDGKLADRLSWVQQNVPLASLLYYRIGGAARFLIDAGSRDDLLRAVEFVDRERPGPVLIIGLGSNLIFPDAGWDGVVIRVVRGGAATMRQREATDSVVTVQGYGGEILDDFLCYTLDAGLAGLEWAGGLPGTLGAGVRGNVGAFGGEVKDTLVSAETVKFQDDGEPVVQCLGNAGLAFSYRDSLVKREPGTVVVAASFELKTASPEQLAEARATYDRNVAYRRRRHPMEFPNCGSVFKNINRPEQVATILDIWPDVAEKVRTNWYGKVSMGYIIGRLGLAGFTVGGAQISEKHNNFIVNRGGARAADVWEIIATVQERVSATFGFVPEVEVEIVEQP